MNNRVYLGLLILGTAFWGISFPLVKDGLTVVDPHVFLIYRFALASIVLSIVFFKYLKKINKETIKYGLIASVPLMIALSLQTICLQYTSSSNASFISGMDILLIPIFKLIFFKKKIQTKVWLACIIAFVGLYIIAKSSSRDGFGYGDILAMIGAISFAIYILMVGKWGSKVETPSLILVQMYSCVVLAIVISIFYVSPSDLILPMEASAWKAVLFTGIFATAFMYSVQNIAQKYIEDEKIALTYLCEPIFATIAAYFLIGEPITINTVIGGTLILFALFIAEYKFKHLHFDLTRKHRF